MSSIFDNATVRYCSNCGMNKLDLDARGLCGDCRWGVELDPVEVAGNGKTRAVGATERPRENRPKAEAPPRLGALSRAESLGLIAKRKPEWRVVGVLSTDDYGVLAGPKGVGKTFALGDLSVAVALGERWFGRFETVRSKVLLLTSEDSRARLWRRADAVAASLGRDPDELEDWLFIHPVSFSAVTDLPRLETELATLEPGLVILDPAYRYMNGVRAQLFDMGGVLTPLQETCREAGAPLLIGHHYNRKEGAQREERISGAGLLEWARLVITAEAPPRRDDDEPVVVTFELSGNSLDPMTFRVRRSVVALDDSPDPELSYSTEVIAEGEAAVALKYLTASERVLAVLPSSDKDAITVREIGDLVAHDGTGKGGLKHGNIRKALNRDLEGRVDAIGDHMDRRWWRSE